MSPRIKIERDDSKELSLFLSFLHHSQFPQHRQLILRAFPKLEPIKAKSVTRAEEKKIVKVFIEKFRSNHQKEISAIIKESEILLKEKSEKALLALGSLMDYSWSKNTCYLAVPTILPFSPFNKNTFYFSILGRIKKRNQKDILSVAIHEISHFILEDILKQKYKKDPAQVLGKTPFLFLKEIVAPVIMNQPPLKKFLNIDSYLGNPFLRHLFVKKDNEKTQITEFFQNIYEKMRYEQQKSFGDILDLFCSLISSIKEEIEEKNNILNLYGNEITQNKDALEAYSRPVQIKNRQSILSAIK